MIAACPETRHDLTQAIGSLVVFSDDWGRHPSSCQHLIRRVLSAMPVLWVNTIGTRAPRLDLQTIRRVAEKLSQWKSAPGGSSEPMRHHPNLTVMNPRMWPWFSGRADRSLNRWLLNRQLSPVIAAMPQPVVAVTTLPITADLAGVLPVSSWVYYCVDDFSVWPGLDGDTLRRMDQDMIRAADSLIAVSETLQQMIAAEGRTSLLLTHGVDVDFWQTPAPDTGAAANLLSSCRGRRLVFWGVIDRRLDTPTLARLSADFPNDSIVLIGPQQDPDPAIGALPGVQMLPAQPMENLPAIAQLADALIMPYADLPVTRAMQPLKLREYLATGRSVIVNQLPSTRAWNDCLDEATSPAEFSAMVAQRLTLGVTSDQCVARERLRDESWQSRAETFLQVIHAAGVGEHSGVGHKSGRASVHGPDLVFPLQSTSWQSPESRRT